MLQVWDTPGQEHYRSVVKIYYRNVQAVVLVVSHEDAPNSDSILHQLRNLEFWLKELSETCIDDQLGFILIGNKSDMAADTEYNDKLIREWCLQ